jgi:GNAT superfamily N-acetyltransferase
MPYVRKATAADVAELAAALAEAFYDDPPARWFFPDDAVRKSRLRGWFSLGLRSLYLRHGHCYTTEDFVGAALWVPPNARHMTPLEQIRLLPRATLLFGRDLPRVLRVVAGGASKRPADPHYYLPFMGVAPQLQGRGIGSALIRPVIERCDREHVAAYLEATTQRNAAFYERHGFKTFDETRLGGDGPPLWLMLRRPPR